MRLLAIIAAFAVIILGGYVLLVDGIPHFRHMFKSQLIAQIMALTLMAGGSALIINLVRRI
jgi:hypothetical protein